MAHSAWNGPKALAAFILAVIAYVLTTTLLFGDPAKPLFLALVAADRLGTPLWRLGVAAAILAATSLCFPPLSAYVRPAFRPAAFVVATVVLSVLIVGVPAEAQRRLTIFSFGADRVIQHSFFRSIREAPRDFQLFLHAAVLKDCVPYAWSYRTMALYSLHPNVAVNVLPREWIADCAIKRDNR